MATKKGIDIAYCQGKVDFAKLKGNVDFVIMQIGYGKYSNQVDVQFERNYTECKKHGIPCGGYWFSYATSAAEAKKEAEVCLSTIKGKQFEYPIYFDVEGKSLVGKAGVSDMCKTFCSTLEKAGYFAGTYISRSPAQTMLTHDVASQYALWIAEYGSKCQYHGSYGMWQYSSAGLVPGISGPVDMDYCYKDYPTIIKHAGLNGFKKSASTTGHKPASKPTTSKPAKKSNEVIVNEVISGKWGVGEARKKQLEAAGYNYEQIQSLVNKKVQSSRKSENTIANEVIQGKWGNGQERKRRLEAAGYSYERIQSLVNKLL